MERYMALKINSGSCKCKYVLQPFEESPCPLIDLYRFEGHSRTAGSGAIPSSTWPGM